MKSTIFSLALLSLYVCGKQLVPNSPNSVARNSALLSTSLIIGGASAALATLNPDVLSGTSRNTETSSQLWYNPRNERIYDTARNSFLPGSASQHLVKELAGRRVVLVGEVHSNPCHHHCEFEILRAIAKTVPAGQIAIGLECFYRQHQGALDRYVLEHGDIAELKRETDWQNTWGFDLNYYAKIFNFAKLNNIRLLGLNAPLDVVRFVGAHGLNALPANVLALLPKVDIENTAHRSQFEKLLDDSGHFSIPPPKMQTMYEAQCLWEDYMADSAYRFAHSNPRSVLLVVAGVGHIQGRLGIPNRLARRLDEPTFVVVPQQVDWSGETGLPIIDEPLNAQDADWVWYTEGSI
jgi:uncharacterized iron-regulated protein